MTCVVQVRSLTSVVVPVVAVLDPGAVQVHLHEKVDPLTKTTQNRCTTMMDDPSIGVE